MAGREALGEAMRAALASPPAGVATTVEIAGARFPGEGVAVVAAVKRVHDARKEPDRAVRLLPPTVHALTSSIATRYMPPVSGEVAGRPLVPLAQPGPVDEPDLALDQPPIAPPQFGRRVGEPPRSGWRVRPDPSTVTEVNLASQTAWITS
ncbi:hypothetical protein [Streptomyces albidoflavus]|uniref:hypothetical protein n=1 Tax=Streptomyces albidoflavus TaxID=1886 RepID=UPI0020D2285A|nr:hypothetical protein [Streptomyces albidoflavus]